MALKKVLGLDLGVSSIGWFLSEYDEGAGNGNILGVGSRIFEPPIENKTEEPKNIKRRTKRGMRRLLARRAMRRDTLVNALVKVGLFPANPTERQKLLNAENPYRLRALGLDAPLSPFQLGRALFHINERRGFLSNRKSAKKKEDGEILKEISALRDEMQKSGARTLGEFLYRRQREAEKKREEARLRSRHTSRQMYMDEFDALWESQRKHQPTLTDDLKKRIRGIIFFQRPLRVQKGLVGFCPFYQWPAENKEGKPVNAGKKRCMRAHPLFQRFRMLQDVNNLTVNGQKLTAEDRQTLVKKLEKTLKLSWDQLRKFLGLDERDIINLERAQTKELKGTETLQKLEKAVGKKEWAALSEEARNGIFEALTTITEDAALTGLLTRKFGLTKESAEALSKVELEKGYAGLSLKAINKIIPHLEQGLVYSDAVSAAKREIEAAGAKAPYADRACFLKEARKILGIPSGEKKHPKLGKPPEIRNPVVQRALHETRRVVNAIIAKFGTPDEIRVELARDMKLSRRRKIEVHAEQSAANDERKKVREILINEYGLAAPSGEDILKYRLWKECGAKCPYTGTPISKEMLFGGAVEIEHIIPWSRSLDDSYMNKTLCLTEENRKKDKQTPWEAYGSDAQRWGEMVHNVNATNFPPGKRDRFFAKELPDDLPSRYLNDTRYMSREARDYMRRICGSVQVTKGGLTAKLRKMWGVNSILRGGAEDDEKALKNRDDHRHHAVDAAVIACTTTSALHRLSRASAREWRVRVPDFAPPWPSFRADLAERVKSMVVSHRPSRKISGALHEETYFGKTNEPGKYVYRVPVAALTPPMVEKIRDPKMREIISKQLEIHGNAKKAAEHCFFESNGRKTPIRKVRILDNKTSGVLITFVDGSGAPYRYAKFGNNHHIEIIENIQTGKWDGVVVTAAEAARRARITKNSIVQKEHGPEWRFVMSLSANEVLTIIENGQCRHFRVQNIWESTVVVLREHFSANIKDNNTRKMPVPNSLKSLNAQKVFVSCLGEIKPAYD